MAFEDFSTKDSVVVVYTGEGKGKTSAGIGLLARALGREWRVAFVQFIKTWETGESLFISKLLDSGIFNDTLTYYRGGKGFYNAGDLSAKNVSEAEHKRAALETYNFTAECLSSGEYQLVICDEINNAVHDGLITRKQLKKLFELRHPSTSFCLTGRDFPDELLSSADIATNMTKIRHHFDDKFLANKGIDY
jgi:cob(I)alamin adenosyltransferase